MLQIENSQNEMDHTLYALDLLTQSEKNLPNTTSSITEQKISTIVQYLKTHSDEPLIEMYHFTLEVMNDLNGYIQTMDKIEEYQQILNEKTDKINVIKSNNFRIFKKIAPDSTEEIFSPIKGIFERSETALLKIKKKSNILYNFLTLIMCVLLYEIIN